MKFSVKSQARSNVSSQNMVGFIDIDKFSIELQTLQKMPDFVPIIPIVKSSKKLSTLGNFSTYRKSISIFEYLHFHCIHLR